MLPDNYYWRGHPTHCRCMNTDAARGPCLTRPLWRGEGGGWWSWWWGHVWSEPVCWSDWPLGHQCEPGTQSTSVGGSEWARTFYSQGKLVPRVLSCCAPGNIANIQLLKLVKELLLLRLVISSYNLTLLTGLTITSSIQYPYYPVSALGPTIHDASSNNAVYKRLETWPRLTAFWLLLSGGWGLIARHFRFTSKKCALTVSRVSTKPGLVDPAQCCGSRRIQFWYSSNKKSANSIISES